MEHFALTVNNHHFFIFPCGLKISDNYIMINVTINVRTRVILTEAKVAFSMSKNNTRVCLC